MKRRRRTARPCPNESAAALFGIGQGADVIGQLDLHQPVKHSRPASRRRRRKELSDAAAEAEERVWAPVKRIVWLVKHGLQETLVNPVEQEGLRMRLDSLAILRGSSRTSWTGPASEPSTSWA
eukprot:scaffold2866_cov248-Pinguiococcus_pyrenoidosus.AAC.3